MGVIGRFACWEITSSFYQVKMESSLLVGEIKVGYYLKMPMLVFQQRYTLSLDPHYTTNQDEGMVGC